MGLILLNLLLSLALELLNLLQLDFLVVELNFDGVIFLFLLLDSSECLSKMRFQDDFGRNKQVLNILNHILVLLC